MEGADMSTHTYHTGTAFGEGLKEGIQITTILINKAYLPQ